MHVRKEKASNWFCWGNNLREKCPVYHHLPSPGVCVLLSQVPVPLIAQFLHPERHCGDGEAVRAVSPQLLEKVYYWEGRMPAFLAQADQHVAPKSICSSFPPASFFSYHASVRKL